MDNSINGYRSLIYRFELTLPFKKHYLFKNLTQKKQITFQKLIFYPIQVGVGQILITERKGKQILV